MSEAFTFKVDNPRRWRSRLITPIRAIGSPAPAGLGVAVTVGAGTPVAVGVRVGVGGGVLVGVGVGVVLGVLVGVRVGGSVRTFVGPATTVSVDGRLGPDAPCAGDGVPDADGASMVGPEIPVGVFSTPGGLAGKVTVAVATAGAVRSVGGVAVTVGSVGATVTANGPAATVGDAVGTASGVLFTRKGRPKVSITASRTMVRTTASNRLKEGHRDGCSRFGGRKISSRIEPRSETEVVRRPSRTAVTASLTRRRPCSKSARGMAGNWTCASSAARRNSGSSSLACSG